MFVGHYGVSFAAKRYGPRLSLGLLFLAVQFLDVLFSIFVLAGVEGLRIVHGFTAYNPYDLYRMPYSHSLLGAAFWSAAAGAAWLIAARRRPPRERKVESALLSAAVFSHFLLDFPMHTADLPLGLGPGSPKIGLGLWNHRGLAVAAELVVLAAGGALYLAATRSKSRRNRIATGVFAVLLVALTVATPFMPDPPSPAAFAVQALASYVLLAVAAELIGRGREPLGAPQP